MERVSRLFGVYLRLFREQPAFIRFVGEFDSFVRTTRAERETMAEYEALAVACSGRSANNQIHVNLTSTITAGGIYWLSSTQTIEPAYTGVAGLLFVSKADISKRVFFPASGYVLDTSLRHGDTWGTWGRYWSSALDTSNTNFAYNSNFNSYINYYESKVESYVDWRATEPRCYGLTVRPVSD